MSNTHRIDTVLALVTDIKTLEAQLAAKRAELSALIGITVPEKRKPGRPKKQAAQPGVPMATRVLNFISASAKGASRNELKNHFGSPQQIHSALKYLSSSERIGNVDRRWYAKRAPDNQVQSPGGT